MPTIDLTDGERALLITALRRFVELDPVSPRSEELKDILEKLEPAKPVVVPDTASTGGRRKNLGAQCRSSVGILLGLIAGFVASKLIYRRGEGIILDTVLGIVGAFVGGISSRGSGVTA